MGLNYLDNLEAYIQTWKGADNKQAIRIFITQILVYSLSVASYGWMWDPLYVAVRTGIILRSFMIFHDCIHGSFFSSPYYNRICGIFMGGLVMTPYKFWKDSHLFHHDIMGNADLFDPARTVRFTKQQYQEFPLWKKIFWRVLRDPFIFFGFIPVWIWFVGYRLRDGGNVLHFHSLFPAVFYSFLYYYGGFKHLMAELLASVLTASLGVLLFHWQHQVNTNFWVSEQKFTEMKTEIAIKGSTFLEIPSFLKWATFGIEYHHIHHLSPRIPCYKLQACHESAPPHFWKDINVVGFRKAFVSFFHTVWDHEKQIFETWEPYKSIFTYFNLHDFEINKSQ